MPTFVVAAAPLWLAPALLLLTAAALVVAGPRIGRPARAGVGALVAALIALAPGASAAWSGQTVLSPLARLARVGSLDLVLGLALDRVSLLVSAGLLVAWIASLLAAPDTETEPGPVARSLAASAFAVAGVLADGFPVLLVSISALVLLTPVATTGARAAPGRFFGMAGAGLVALVFGATLLFWALGGRWLDDARYFSDYRARFVIAGEDANAAPTRPTSPNAQGSITIVSHPGARIYDGVADEAQLLRSLPIAVSPAVRVPVVAGLHKIAIAPGEGAVVGGDGLEVALLDVVKIREGDETVIVLQGPTVTFHEITQQLQDPAAFTTRRIFTLPAAAFVTAAFLAALLCFALALRSPVRGPFGALAAAGSFAVVSMALARLAPLLVQAPAIGLLFALVAAGTATVWAVGAVRSPASAEGGLLGAIGMLALAAGTTAPAAPACAMVSAAFGAVFLGRRAASREALTTKKPEGKPKKKKKAAAEAPATAPATTAAPAGSGAGLVLAALSGAPLPGGLFAIGATGIASAFAGMGPGNAASAACVLVTWASLVAIAWRTSLDGAAPPKWLGAAALVASPLIALAIAPWDVPANVANDARAGLAFGGFVVALAAFFHARRQGASGPRPSEERAATASRLTALAPIGRALDRALGAPLDLLALPFTTSKPADVDAAAQGKEEGSA